MSFEYHPAVLASDTTDYQAGTLTRIGEAASKGLPAAAISGAMSIYNTFLFKENEIDTEAAVRRYGGDDIGDYYVENRDAIDTVGFIGTSLIPGTLGVKGLTLARSGTTLGNFSKTLNLASTRKNEYLQAALQETARSGGTVKSILSANRLKYVGWEVADQAQTALAFELAVAATMNDSPVFDGDSLGDFAWNIGLGAGLGGVIGGAFGSIAAKGILKSAQTEVQALARTGDVFADPSRMGLEKGTEALIMAESLMKLPGKFDDFDFKYKLDGKVETVKLEAGQALENIAMDAQRYGRDQLQLKFNEIAGGDERIGQAFFRFFEEAVDSSKAMGLQPTEVVQKLHGYLGNLSRVQSLNLEQIALDKRKFYVSLSAPEGDDLARVAGLLSPKRTAKTGKQAYVMADDSITAADIQIEKIENLGEVTIRDAFKANPDIDVIQLTDGTLRVNPKSSRVVRLRENPVQVRQLIDLETGSLTNETAAVIGDVLQKGKLTVVDDAIYVNNQRYAQPASKVASMADSPMESSARWGWASKLTAGQVSRLTQGTVNIDDFPMMTRLLELADEGAIAENQLLKFGIKIDDEVVPYADIVDLRKAFADRKLEWLETNFANWNAAMGSVPDTRVLAAHLNTDYAWVEGVISRGFRAAVRAEEEVGKVLPTAAALNPRTVQAVWDFGVVPKMIPEEAFNMNMGPSHLVTKELTKEYQRAIRSGVGQRAIGVLGEDAAEFRAADELLSQDTSLSGAGATLFGASNAGYGERAKLWVQNTGAAVARVAQRRKDETVETLSPAINALRSSPRASAELGIVTNMLRRSKHRYVFSPDDPMMLVSEEAMRAARLEKTSIDNILAKLPEEQYHPHGIRLTEDSVQEFLRTSTNINATRQGKFTTLYNATGLVRKLPREAVVYVPPINTVRYPFHAFVKTKNKVGLASDVGMVTARTEEQLRTLTASLEDDFDIFFKQDTDTYFKIRGEYDYQQSLNEASVSSELARRGKLADVLPETRFENIIEDWVMWHGRQEEKLVRDAVQVQSRQFFSEMQHLSNQYRKVSESVTRGIGSVFKKKVADPFGDYIKTALNISKQQEFPLLDSLNDFVDKVGLQAGDAIQKAFGNAQRGILSYEDANKVMGEFGLGTFYRDPEQYFQANQRVPKNLIREGFQKVNMALASTMLRLDFANSLVNIISTPILLGTEMASIKRMIAGDDVAAGKLRELMTLPLPGNPAVRVPSTTKLLGDAVNNFFGDNKFVLLERYRRMGAIKDVNSQFHQMLDISTYDPVQASKFVDNAKKVVEIGAKIAGNNFAEDFTRFVSADVMRQLSDPLVQAGRLTVKEQNAFISTFVNRVQGNYVTSQRPIVFQGTTGAAVSLFQTFAFNVLQQLYRHAERGDKKTLAVFAGLQGTIFGLNGLPFFDAVNTHLIGGMVANNPEHKDIYSVLPSFNKDLGDWMLYGTASAFPLFSGSSPAFFTRGDMNPRHMLILPTAVADVPAVSASIKLVSQVYDFGKQVSGGADMGDAMLQALEHQGWNRPLAGFAQLLAGQSTDNKGALISAANELATTATIANWTDRTISAASRVMGARPMDEAVALNAMYRNKSYEAMDRARIERLGEVVKTKLYGNEVPSDEELEDFMLRYTRSGGRLENFNRAMQQWSRDANVSIVNQLAEKMGSPYSQKLQMIMGADGELMDYRNSMMPGPMESDTFDSEEQE